MAVTTALCADRTAVAATPPSARPQGADWAHAAEGLVSRLASGFRRVGAGLRAGFRVNCECPARPRSLAGRVLLRGVRPPVADADVVLARPPLSPFQFRLPPPFLG